MTIVGDFELSELAKWQTRALDAERELEWERRSKSKYISGMVEDITYLDWDRIFFTADNHFGHTNIIKYCGRPFSNVDEMDATMIERWNNVVPPDGVVYHLGDFTLADAHIASELMKKLNGQIVILANPWHHDRRWMNEIEDVSSDMMDVGELLNVKIMPPMLVLEYSVSGSEHASAITLCHYPLEEWDRKHYGALHLHGHSHGRAQHIAKRIDVGVDSNNFEPVSLLQVVNYLAISK